MSPLSPPEPPTSLFLICLTTSTYHCLTPYMFYLFFYFTFSDQFLTGRDSGQFCALLRIQCLEWSLAFNRYSVNIYWIHKWEDRYFHFLIFWLALPSICQISPSSSLLTHRVAWVTMWSHLSTAILSELLISLGLGRMGTTDISVGCCEKWMKELPWST